MENQRTERGDRKEGGRRIEQEVKRRKRKRERQRKERTFGKAEWERERRGKRDRERAERARARVGWLTRDGVCCAFSITSHTFWIGFMFRFWILLCVLLISIVMHSWTFVLHADIRLKKKYYTRGCSFCIPIKHCIFTLFYTQRYVQCLLHISVAILQVFHSFQLDIRNLS